MKCCARCKIDKQISNFAKNKTAKDGLQSYCRECIASFYQRDKTKKDLYRMENREKLKQKSREWYIQNREYAIKRASEYSIQTRKNDPLKKMRHNISNLIRNKFQRKGYTKRSKAQILLGADYSVVYEHLMETGRKNYGINFTEKLLDYEIDHIIPCAVAKTEESLIQLQHYTNLQLLTSTDNNKKNKR